MNGSLSKVTRMAGGQNTRKRSATVRRMMAAGLALTCLGTVSPAVADFGSDVTLKLGASGLFNHRLVARQAIVGQRQAGGHFSLDFTGPGRAFAFSPFVDIYHRIQTDARGTRPRNDEATNWIAGANFIFSGPRSDRSGIYFGLGGGVTRMKVATDIDGAVVTTGYKTRMMADGLLGAEVKMSRTVSLFVEPHYVWTTKMLNGFSAHTGLAFHLGKDAQAAPVRSPIPVYIRQAAPVSMKEAPAPVAPVQDTEAQRLATGAEGLLTMQELIYFAHDKSDISEEAKAILDDKVKLFRSNPGMEVVIAGFASQPGTEDYNMALGMRRAVAAKEYLVSQGVHQSRIQIETRGEGQLVVSGPGEAADAQNRRNQFRLLVADPYLVAPGK